MECGGGGIVDRFVTVTHYSSLTLSSFVKVTASLIVQSAIVNSAYWLCVIKLDQ